jgi:hypothetical protein
VKWRGKSRKKRLKGFDWKILEGKPIKDGR